MSTGAKILAIDPGLLQSAWVIFVDGRIRTFGITPNEDLIEDLRDGGPIGPDGHYHFDEAVIEQIESYGMAVGREVFETVRWAGRLEEAIHPVRVVQMPRRTVKTHLCGSAKAKDPNIRQALIDRFGGAGGKAAAIGTKAHPGPLHGISKDVWSALAIAVTYADTEVKP